MQLRQADAAAAHHYRLRVMRLVAGDGAEQAVVDERLERPAASLGREHRLQADTGATRWARAFVDLQLHGLADLLLQLLQVALVFGAAHGAQRLLQRQALAGSLGHRAEQQREAGKGKRAGKHGHDGSSLITAVWDRTA
ncbi:protein of unknown function [Pseudomonas sp. JV241A]|nr:protein of unknown function [Pseudomonas sp. JV241A]